MYLRRNRSCKAGTIQRTKLGQRGHMQALAALAASGPADILALSESDIQRWTWAHRLILVTVVVTIDAFNGGSGRQNPKAPTTPKTLAQI